MSFSQRLSVQTSYLGREHLASYYVQTPDPYLRCPTIGQRLIISWAVSKKDLTSEDLHLNLKIRLRNREEKESSIPITQRRGYHVYDIVNERYTQSGGILTYKIDLIGNGCVLETWLHPLWVELIRFDNPPKS